MKEKTQLSVLLDERRALRKEMSRVLIAINNAPHMTPSIKAEVCALYEGNIAKANANIAAQLACLARQEGGFNAKRQ